jgi:tRNA A-37 threonylcarbamoyl transferase component Bud32
MRRVGVPVRCLVPALAGLVYATGCARETRHASPPRAEPELRFYRDLPIDGVGGDVPAMHVDPEGGLWVAVAGASDKNGRSRLYHRPKGGAWTERYRGSFASELSLSSYRGGEVFFGFNQPLDGFRPTLLRVTADHVETLPAPAERIDAREWLQVGSYAMLSPSDGWACGQRGRLWRFREGAFVAVDPVLPWKPGDPANASYCASLRVTKDRGYLVDFQGHGAVLEGGAWKRLADDVTFVLPASGLALGKDAFLRHDGRSLVAIAGVSSEPTSREARSEHGTAVFDETGRWVARASGILDLAGDRVRSVRGTLPFAPRAISATDEGLFVLAADGVHRGTDERVPTFVPPPVGSLPAGLVDAMAMDLDGDGLDDVVGLATQSGEARGLAAFSAYRALGGGRFTSIPLGMPHDIDAWRGRYDLGDLDGDGDLDLVTATAGHEVVVWSHRGDSFSRSTSFPIDGAAIALVDVDADGDLDLSLSPAKPSLLLNDGVGHFSPGPDLPLPIAVRTERVIWEDVNGDGRPDAVLLHWRDPAHVALSNGRGGFELVELGAVAEGAAFADLDRDGRPELLAQTLHIRNEALPHVRCVWGGGFQCAEGSVPNGTWADLDADGRDDLIVSDLRGDESMTSSGSVYLSREGGFRDITTITGPLPQPTVLDADGDGDLDVYAAEIGLRMATGDFASTLRVRPRSSESDRLAHGAWVVARATGDEKIVASGRADHGWVTLGLPDASFTYDVEVRFPTGRTVIRHGVRAGEDREIHDREGWAHTAHLAVAWMKGTAQRIQPFRDLAIPAFLLAAMAIGGRRVRSLRSGPVRLGIAFGAAFIALSGITTRAGGAVAFFLGPAAAVVAIAFELVLVSVERRRAARRAGPYVLLERLGAGAAATVWRAKAGRSEVALKLFDAEVMQSSDARERFFREARVGAEIAHRHVVAIRDSGQLEDGRCYLAMELVRGRSLGVALRAEGKLDPGRAAEIAAGVADGLAALHARGIVHRDIKPDNVLLREDGSAVVSDLGLARSAMFKTMTRHDVAVGTLSYMSPEQSLGRPLDGRSDLWSVGVTLYEMLTGARPFLAEHEIELLYVLHNCDPDPPTRLAPEVSPALEAVVLRCLRRDREERFASAESLAAALRSAVAARAPEQVIDPTSAHA